MGRNGTGVIAFVIVASFLSYFCFFDNQGLSQTTFAPTDRFDIPVNNSSISFAFAGTYEQASLENGVWSFVNLQFNSSQRLEKLSFKVSATDSTVNITTCSIYDSTFAGEHAKRATLRYHVVGQGIQVFDFGLDAERGNWSVIRNSDTGEYREYLRQNRDWSLSPNGTVTVTEVTGNVTIAYYGFPGSFGEGGDGFNQPFLNQHSAIIATTIAVVVIVLLAVTVAIRTRKKEKTI